MALEDNKKEIDLSQTISPNRLIGVWRLIKGFRVYYFVAILALGIAAASKTTTYLLLRYFVDTVLQGNNTKAVGQNLNQTLFFIALGFLGLAATEGSFSFISGRMSAYTAEGIAFRLRNYLYDHIQRLSFTYHDKTQTGELIQRSTSDVDALRRFYADQAIGVGRILLLFLINFIALLQLNWQLALISVIAIPFIVITSAFFFRKVSKAYEAYQEQDAKLSTTLQENLTGVRVVKAFARQEYEIGKFDKDNSEKFSLGKRLLLMHTFFWPISDILCGFQMLGGFFAAALMAINGQITVGTYLAYAGLVVWLIWPMRNLGRLIVQTSTGLVSYGRVRDVIVQCEEPLDEGVHHPAKIKGHIVYQNVGFEYETNVPVLQDINFECKPGSLIALLGATGSGKTTLVNLLPRFYEYTNGSVILDNVELKSIPRKILRKYIGIVEQEPFLFSRTIKENITYGVGRDIPQIEIENAAKAAAIHDVIITFPDGYNTLVGEKGVTLSGGQKQRVAIARTLLKDPRILILDDSTSSVDTETEASIRQALQVLMKNRTTFIIAHRIQSVMNADLILVLERGKIVQMGAHDELLSQDGIYRKIFEIQTRIDTEVEQEIAGASLIQQT